MLDEVTKLRVSWEELSAQHVKAEDTIESLQNEVARQKGLNEKLENDLMGLDGKGDRGASVPAQGGQGLAGLDIGGKSVSCLSDIDSRLALIRQSQGPAPANGDTSILPIVTSQRDRFRQRNAELEEVRRLLSSFALIKTKALISGTAQTVREHIRLARRNQVAPS